jgi:O-antigen/teichoic acid export membrane protein
MGLYTIGVREMSKHPEKEEMVLGNMMTARSVVILLVTVLAVLCSFFFFDYGEALGHTADALQLSNAVAGIAPWAIAIASLATVFAILTGTVSTTLQVHLKMEKNSWGSILGKLAALAYMAIVIFWWFPHSCNGDTVKFLIGDDVGACTTSAHAFQELIFAGLFGNIVMFAITAYYANKLTKIAYRFDWWFWKEVLWKALPYGLALVLNQVYFRIGSMFLFRMKGPEYVATYSAPSTMLEAAGIVPLYFMNAILPFLTKALHAKDGSHKKIIQISFDMLMMASLPIVTGTVVLAYQFIVLVATPEFLTNMATGYWGSDVVLQILIIALLFSFLNGLFGYVLVASEHQDKLLWRNFFGAILTALLTWWWVPQWEVRGAAFANILTEFYIFVASYVLAKRYVDFKLTFGTFWRTLLSTVVMGVILWWAKDPTYYLWHLGNKNVLLLIPLAMVVYFVMLRLTGALTKEMLAMVLKRKMVPAGETASGASTDVASEAAGTEVKDSENLK